MNFVEDASISDIVHLPSPVQTTKSIRSNQIVPKSVRGGVFAVTRSFLNPVWGGVGRCSYLCIMHTLENNLSQVQHSEVVLSHDPTEKWLETA